ncbi:hypothetical protein D3C81_1509070 [compost metagenome]
MLRTPGGWRLAELADEPAGERAGHRITEHVGDAPQRIARAFQIAHHQVAAYAVDQLAEGRAFFFQAPLQGAHVHALGLRDVLDGGAAHGHQQEDRLAHFQRERWQVFVLQQPHITLRQPRHAFVGLGVGGVQVGRRADDAIEVGVELQLAAEDAPVDGQVGGGGVGEVGADRVPVRAQ